MDRIIWTDCASIWLLKSLMVCFIIDFGARIEILGFSHLFVLHGIAIMMEDYGCELLRWTDLCIFCWIMGVWSGHITARNSKV